MSKMVRRIYKYPLNLGITIIPLHSKIYKIVLVAAQHDDPHVWIEVEVPVFSDANALSTTECYYTIKLLVVGTGQDVPETGTHVGSWLMRNDTLVFHLYDIT